MSQMSTGRTGLLFLLVAAVSAAGALPLFGLVPTPWSDGPPAAGGEVKEKPAAPGRKAEQTAASASPSGGMSAPRKKTRIVWMGGGGESSASGDPRAAMTKTNPTVPRMTMNSGSTVKIQPVGGYIATTASPGARRSGG